MGFRGRFSQLSPGPQGSQLELVLPEVCEAIVASSPTPELRRIFRPGEAPGVLGQSLDALSSPRPPCETAQPPLGLQGPSIFLLTLGISLIPR